MQIDDYKIIHGTAALIRVLKIGQRHSVQGRVCGRLLLGLYNEFWSFDLTLLQRLDAQTHSDALEVLTLARNNPTRIEEWFEEGDKVWWELKIRWSTAEEARRFSITLHEQWLHHHKFDHRENLMKRFLSTYFQNLDPSKPPIT